MVRSVRLACACASLLVVLALTLGFAAARAGTARADAPTPTPSPTIVREDVSKRTEFGSTYVLSDGTYRDVLSQTPIHFKDASGTWQNIDPTLVPTGDGAVTTAAAPVALRSKTSLPGKPGHARLGRRPGDAQPVGRQ